MPCKATCRCLVGLIGVCCHILALWLYLKRYTDTKEKILELTCTQQLQKWHRRSKKGSIPMVSLNEIKPKSASMRKKENSPADPNSSSFFRGNVPSIIANLKEKFKQEKPTEAHIHLVLMNSSVGRSSSVGLHLDYKFSLRAAESLADHCYCREELFDVNVINIDPQKYLNINRIIETKYNNSEPSAAANLDFKSRNENLAEKIVLQSDLELIITKSVMHQGPKNIPLHNEIICQINGKVEIAKLDLNFLEAPKPSRDNYVHVTQNSLEWFSVRKCKVIILHINFNQY